MIENFPNHKKEMTHNIQSTFSRLNIKRSSPGHVIIKLSKVKEFLKQQEKSYVEGETVCKFLNINFLGQKGMR